MPTYAISVSSLSSYNVSSKKAGIVHVLSLFLFIIIGLPFLLRVYSNACDHMMTVVAEVQTDPAEASWFRFKSVSLD